jgi:nitric oxide reductase large subunit
MNTIRKLMGIVWIAMALAAGYYLIVSQAIPKFQTGKTGDLIPAIIYTFILTPIIVGGLSVFGVYALKGEYKIDQTGA